jgi:hypothetical protein
MSNPLIRFVVTGFALAVAMFASTAAHAQHTMPGSMSETFKKSCTSQIPNLPVAVDRGFLIGTTTAPAYLVGLSHATGQATCADYTWIKGWFGFFGLVTPFAGWPAITTSAWDCNHSTVDYGVYVKWGASWTYLGGGLLYGKLVNGVCTHAAANFPQQAGSVDSVFMPNSSVPWVFAPTEFRVATRVWNHDDPTIGHPGNVCGGNVNCWWLGMYTFAGN